MDPYTVLGLARGADAAAVRHAYKRALLQNHPDKAARPAHTIDAVNAAYRALQAGWTPREHALATNFSEVVDLGDFAESQHGGAWQWTRACRCGAEYVLTEQDLDTNADADEIAVQCRDCSIWILVQYAVE